MSELKINKEMLFPLTSEEKDMEELNPVTMSYWSEVKKILLKNKLAMLGILVICILILSAVFLPMFFERDYSDDNLDRVNIPPIFNTYKDSYGHTYFINKDYRVYLLDNGKIIESLLQTKEDFMKSIIYLGETPQITMDYSDKKNIIYKGSDGKELISGGKVLNKEAVFGTDIFGRDLFIRIIYGARISLSIAFVATVVNLFIGTIYGGISGYSSSKVDNIMMRIVDFINTIPLTLYVILIMVLVGAGIKSIIIALSSVYWVGMARLVRGQVLSIKQQEFVLAAKTMGSSNIFILFKHLLPNAMGPIIVSMTMLIPKAIFVEAFLSYIGLGVPRPMASWGTLSNDAVQTLNMYSYQLIAPALAISITMFAFSFLGDGLRDALDPRLRK